MRADANAVPLDRHDLHSYHAVLSAQACMLVSRLPADVLVAILPVLEKYAGQCDGECSPATREPDRRRMTIHLRPPSTDAHIRSG